VFVNQPLSDSLKLEVPKTLNFQTDIQLRKFNDGYQNPPESSRPTNAGSPTRTTNEGYQKLNQGLTNFLNADTNFIRRPELQQFADRSVQLGLQQNLITSRNRPKTSLFIQGGYGRPALNLLKNQFDWYYVGGIRLNWNLGGLYTAKKERQLIDISQKNLQLQQETFLLNTRAELATQLAEIKKLRKMINTDLQIIDLRNQVREASKAQLENGVITASDYLREINASDQASQSRITHEIQLLQAIINYQNTSGKY